MAMVFRARLRRPVAVIALLTGIAGCADAVTLPGPGTVADDVFGPRNLTAPAPGLPPSAPPAAKTQPMLPLLLGDGARVYRATYATSADGADAPTLSPVMVRQDADLIAAAMAAEVPHALALSPERQDVLIGLAKTMAENGHFFVRRPQLVLVVDRALKGQTLSVTLAQPDGDWVILGTRSVSTGKPGRKEHFKTPVGVLLNDGSELGYRAQGTYNENHIRGLGVKGMRVWDFGWQTSDDWRTPGATMQVRVEMHATDPAVLAARLGRADSEGCIRLPEAVNRFLDRHGIIDADIEKLGETDNGYRALLSPYLTPTALAGVAVIVVDTSEPWAKPYPPATTLSLSG
ncbi:L,D-transpeptidase [Acidisoma silvae]|nr:L,D-transpeptidase [Acidisoma silvae]